MGASAVLVAASLMTGACSSGRNDATTCHGLGCACPNEGATIECGETKSVGGDSLTCRRGTRTCGGGQWGACVGETTAIQSLPPAGTKGLGTSTTCADNPCDPDCKRITDDGVGLDAGPGLTPTDDGGISILKGDAPVGPGCTGLVCDIVKCTTPGVTTNIVGRVFDPAGYNPLYNAVVYIPNAPLSDFTPGVACDKCVAGSGSPIVTTTTDANGDFTLKNVPSGTNIPLVIQIGRWRRKVTIPSVTPCVDNSLAKDNSTAALRTSLLTRLPRNKTDGDGGKADIPLMAIASGSADPFECLLLKMGIDKAEFTVPTGTGRVHYYRSNGKDMSPAAPAASTLWGSLTELKQHDIVFLPCEGGENKKGATPTQNIIDYTTVGGRVFTTHYGYVWLQFAAAPFPSVATWNHSNAFDVNDPLWGRIDTTFPKGLAFAQWLDNVNATTVFGELGIHEGRWDETAVNAAVARQWITAHNHNAALPNTGVSCTAVSDCGSGPYLCSGKVKKKCTAKSCTVDGDCGSGYACVGGICGLAAHNMQPLFTFNTPVGAAVDSQCGRIVYSDFHVSASALSGSTYFPDSCITGIELSEQEKSLEFMVFDLSSCITPDVPVSTGTPPYPSPVTFSRDYDASCPAGTKVVWRFFDWQTITPSDSQITFAAQSADTTAGLSTATSVALGSAYGAPITIWTGADVGAALATIPPVSSPLVASKTYLRVNITLVPSTDKMSAPTLSAWRQTYDCLASE